jgi:hypothetical protein
VYRGVRENSGIEFAFDREDRQKHVNSYSFYLRTRGRCPPGAMPRWTSRFAST